MSNNQRQINLLFLGGAKRVSMARKFKAAAGRLGHECNIYSYELDTREAIACEATVIKGLRWKDTGVDADLRRICQEKGICAIIPFVDGAVEVAARLNDIAFVPACTPGLAAKMFDKVEAAVLFEQLGLPVPRTYQPGMPCLRLIAKPRRGSASKGIVEIHSLEQIDRLPGKPEDYLIQERIDNREEYTVDCYVNVNDGTPLAICPRQRLEVSGGEVTKTVSVESPEIVSLSRKVLAGTKLRGAVTIQFMRDTDDGRLLLMEINPRLGGGAVCSVAAGADITELILRQALGMPVKPVDYTRGVTMARYPEDVVFYPEKK